MRLPFINMESDLNTLAVDLKGIELKDEAGHLRDLVNIVGDACTVRPARRAVMLWSSPPDQVITVGERLFYRYANSLREVGIDSDGELEFMGNEYSLKEYENPPDRHLIWWNNKLCVIPDCLGIGEDEKWLPFGNDCSLEARFPFINDRTFFYTSGFNGGEVCNDSAYLEVGVKIRFDWLEGQEFTVVSREVGCSLVDGVPQIEEGVLITLDRGVEDYDSLPLLATADYCQPKVTNLLPSLHIGYNGELQVSTHTIRYYLNYCGLTYDHKFSDYLQVGQKVRISGCPIDENNRIATVEGVYDNTIILDCQLTPYSRQDGSQLIITPLIPDFDFTVFAEDRLFGISNADRTLYISHLRQPFLFYDKVDKAENSWSVQLNEQVTGLTLWKDNIICFTESGGFRVLGYTALNFGLRQLSVSGIKRGCSGSLTRMGDTLYYCSDRGIMKYSGGGDRKISNPILKDLKVTRSVSDGRYVYMLEGDRIWVYSPDGDNWWSEDARGIINMQIFNGYRYLFGQTAVYISGGGDALVEWRLETDMITDTTPVEPLFVSLAAKGEQTEVDLYVRRYGESEPTLYKRKVLLGEGLIKADIKGKIAHGFSVIITGRGAAKLYDLKLGYRRIR